MYEGGDRRARYLVPKFLVKKSIFTLKSLEVTILEKLFQKLRPTVVKFVICILREFCKFHASLEIKKDQVYKIPDLELGIPVANCLSLNSLDNDTPPHTHAHHP